MRGLPRDLRRVFVGAEDVRLEAEPVASVSELIGVRALPRARVDDEEAVHRVSIAFNPRKGAPCETHRKNRRRPRAVERARASLLHALELRRADPRRARALRRRVPARRRRAGGHREARPATRSTRARRPSMSRCGTSSPPPSAPRRTARRAPRRPSAWSRWTAPENRREALAVMYAIEAGQPAVSQTKLDGLAEHYGVASDEPGAAYFALHSERDHEHAAESRRELELVHGGTTTAWSRLPKRRSGVTGRCWTESTPGGKPMNLFRGLPGHPLHPPLTGRDDRRLHVRDGDGGALEARRQRAQHGDRLVAWRSPPGSSSPCRRRSPASPTGSTSRVGRRSGAPPPFI